LHNENNQNKARENPKEVVTSARKIATKRAAKNEVNYTSGKKRV
jgi:hypothetical protein